MMNLPRYVCRVLTRGRKEEDEDYLVQECVQLLLAENARLRAYRDSLRPTRLSRRAKGVIIQVACGLAMGAMIVGVTVAATDSFTSVDDLTAGARDGQEAAMRDEDAVMIPLLEKLGATKVGEAGAQKTIPAPDRKSR